MESLEEVYYSDLTHPKFKSAKFVGCFGKNLYEKVFGVRSDSPDPELAVQEVKEDGSEKGSKEWRLDIGIKKKSTRRSTATSVGRR